MKRQPPKWANRFLEWYCNPELLEEIQGDVHQLFYRTLKEDESKARLLFVWNVMRFFRWRNIKRRKTDNQFSLITMGMLLSYLKSGWRNVLRTRAFSLINVMGLAIGLASFLLIFSFVYDELLYDRFPKEAKNIYRVELKLEQNGGIDKYPHVDVAVAGGMKATYPEIVNFTRMAGAFTDHVRYEDINLKEELLVYADSNVLTFFSIPLIEGNPAKALVEPGSIVISKAFAQKYFGDKPALGQTLTLRNNGLVKVSGVFEKLPEHSHFHYDAFLSNTQSWMQKMRQTWTNVGFFSYIQLNEHADPHALEAKLPGLVEKYVIPEIQEDAGLSYNDAAKTVDTWKFYLMPLEKIHLHSHTKYEIEPNGDINNVYIFSALAVFILLLACINFMNLSTATSAKRSVEIGVRKTMGSFRGQLVAQFLIESLILTSIALFLALAIAFVTLPFFNELTGKHITIQWFLSPTVLLTCLVLGVVVGVLAGLYPAIFLSSFKTVQVLKGSATGSHRSRLRSVLVVFQFSISTALIIATIVAYEQLHYLQNIDLGYDKEQIVVIENGRGLGTSQAPFKQKILQDPRVTAVSFASVPIGNAGSFGGSEVAAKERNTANVHAHFFNIDYDFIETMGMEVVLGRNFSNAFVADSLAKNVIINETAMRDLGWNEKNVLGSVIQQSAQRQYEVVGVVKDFHYTSAKDKIAPLIMVYRPQSATMLVKVKTADVKEFLADTKTLWGSFDTGLPFSYFFLDDRFAQLYRTEQATEKIFIVFMVIAISIACLGLYGLSTYSAEQRMKEIGIRKVLGSSVNQIIMLQSREFLFLVLIGIVIAAPFSWWAMSQWLQNFGYRVDMKLWFVVLAAGSAILIALVTVSFQAFKAAVANPVNSLRAQ
jgi:putative ABC transport system permease protein